MEIMWMKRLFTYVDDEPKMKAKAYKVELLAKLTDEEKELLGVK
jgi:hypothetical protein